MIFSILLSLLITAQQSKIDTTVINKIKKENKNISSPFKLLNPLCDRFGPRLTWSPEYTGAAQFVSKKLKDWGLNNVHYEEFEPIGKNWSINSFSAQMTEPHFMSLVAYPKAWSPATNGEIESEVIYFDAKNEKDFEKYFGKLKGKILILNDLAYLHRSMYTLNPNYYKDSTLLSLVDELPDTLQTRNKKLDEVKYLKNCTLIARKVEFCKKESVALIMEPSYTYYGIVKALGVITTIEPKSAIDFLAGYGSNPDFEESVPQMTISLEHYNHILRLIKDSIKVRVKANIDVMLGKPRKGFNVIAEIPGSDLKDEIVMIGAHLDSFHAGTGAADNAVGVVTCMMAMKILNEIGIKPLRTIRIGLWGGEEEGCLGSKAYVKEHFMGTGKEKCYVYLNMDYGSGTIRGIYTQGNSSAKKILTDWFGYIQNPKIMVAANYTDIISDESSFIEAGLPGFIFLQDNLLYPKFNHSNMDMIERISSLGHFETNPVNIAILTYLASMQEGDFPAKAK